MNTQQDADLAFEKKRYKKAADLYQLLIKQEPENAQFHENLADCYFHLGRLDAAFTETGLALEINPDLARSHSIRGSIYYRQQRYEESEREENKAIELDPARKEPYGILAGIAAIKKDHAKSIRLLREALQYNPDDWMLHRHLSWVYGSTKQYKEATHEIRLAYKFHPSFSTLLDLLTVYQALFGRWIITTLAVILFIGPFLFRLIYFLPANIVFVIYLAILGVHEIRLFGFQRSTWFRISTILFLIISYIYIFLYRGL